MTAGARADRVALVGLLLTLAASTIAIGARLGVPGIGAPSVRAVAMVVAADDGSMVYAHLAQGDGGLVEQQVTTRVAHLSAGAPILHRAQHLPTGAQVDEGIRASPDTFVRDGEGRAWRLQVGGDAVRANVSLRDVAATACDVTPAHAGGALTQGDQAAFVVGPALVVRRGTSGRHVARAMWAVGVGVGVGVDLASSESACPAWTWTASGPVTSVSPPSRAELDAFRARGDTLRIGDGPAAWRLTLDEVSEAVPMDPLAHLTFMERVLARPVLGGASTLARARVRVEIPGRPPERIGALLLLPGVAPG